MSDHEDRIIEAMARAMCIANGEDPDWNISCNRDYPRPNWTEWKGICLRQYRAWLAMQSVILGEAPSKSDGSPKGGDLALEGSVHDSAVSEADLPK